MTETVAVAGAIEEERSEEAVPAWGAVVSLTLGVFGLVTAEFLPASLLTLSPAISAFRRHRRTGGDGDSGNRRDRSADHGDHHAEDRPQAGDVGPDAAPHCFQRALGIGLVAAGAAVGPRALGHRARRLLVDVGGGDVAAGARPPLFPRAMSIILTGVSVATVCAAPVGAYVGDIWGWRTAFMIAAAVGVVTLVVQAVTLPRLPPVGVASFRALVDVAGNPLIRIGLLFILIAISGQFAGFTYIRAFLEQVPALGIETISLVLLAYGMGGFFGNFAGGFVAERSLKAALTLAPLLIAAAMLLLVVLRGFAGAGGGRGRGLGLRLRRNPGRRTDLDGARRAR